MRYLVLLIAILLGVGFVFLNWTEIMSPVEVNLMFTTAPAPLGMMIIIWFGVLFLIVAYGMLVQQARAMNTASKLSKALSEQKKLAANAEESRLSEVKTDFDSRWKRFLDQEKQLFEESEQRMKTNQEKIMVSFKEVIKQNEQSNQDLAKSVSAALDTMDNKINKVLIAAQSTLDAAKSSSAGQKTE